MLPLLPFNKIMTRIMTRHSKNGLNTGTPDGNRT